MSASPSSTPTYPEIHPGTFDLIADSLRVLRTAFPEDAKYNSGGREYRAWCDLLNATNVLARQAGFDSVEWRERASTCDQCYRWTYGSGLQCDVHGEEAQQRAAR